SKRDWSSDVCSSDLAERRRAARRRLPYTRRPAEVGGRAREGARTLVHNAPIDRGGRMFELGRSTTHRRGFLGRIAASAAAFGLGGLVAPFDAAARPTRAATG